MDHIVMYSGGIGSWAAAKRVVEQHGTANTTLLFADTLIEDPDLYRFLNESAENVGVPVTRIADGRTPFQVFRDSKFLGNHRVDPCSKELKRELCKSWLQERFTPETCIQYFGIDWTEAHRLERMKVRHAPWQVDGPLCCPPYLMKPDLIQWAIDEGLRPPALYELGFPHNNCGGACIKAGKSHWVHLCRTLPEVYNRWEREEKGFRRDINENVTILEGITLTELREQVEKGDIEQPKFDWGGCGCFAD